MTPISPFPAALSDERALPVVPPCARPVGECVARLTWLFAFQRELLRTEAAWLAGVRHWDAKQAIARHVLADAQQAEATLRRLHELKATSAEHKEMPGLEEAMRDIASARHGDEWLHGLYLEVKPWLARQLARYREESDPVMDAPTHELIEGSLAELRRQTEWFRGFVPQFSPWEQAEAGEWRGYVAARLRALAADDAESGAGASARPPGDRREFAGVAQVRRDPTFRVASKTEFPREGADFAEKRFLVFYNHSQEMQFAESLGAILYETAAMPWAFHHDLARHLADEVRHATMGQARLAQLGVALTDVPMLTQHYAFRANLDPLERFCLMTLVMEATAFERKRANVELFEQNGDAVSALYESYDIRDEMLHTNLGHTWVPILLRVYHDSRSVAELTDHCRSLIAQVITEYPANAANMATRR